MKQSFFLLLLLTCGTLFAQTRQIKGKVMDDAGAPLQGVNVLVSGTQKGVQTDATGSFAIEAPGTGAVTLVISYSGFKSQTLKADANTELGINPKSVLNYL